MTDFEFLFTFAGLLLGLAVAAVATGFADMWRARRTRKVGVATPLLGLYILLAAAEAWMALWGARDFLKMGPAELLRSIGIAMPYIFVAQGMFPSERDDSTSLEDYYVSHSRVLLAVLMIPTAVSFLFNLAIGFQPQAMDLLGYGLPFAVLVLMILCRRPGLHWLGLLTLSANALVLMFA
jgi:hypothetical protein